MPGETSAPPASITILMPSLNEAGCIREQIARLPVRALQEKGHDVQVLLVDGMSEDGTAEAARQTGIEVDSCERGYGVQYQKGFALARGDIIVTCDADLSYPVERFVSLVDLLERDGLDFITVNRFARLRPGAMHPLHWIGNQILSQVTRWLFRLPLRDSQSGMWVFRRGILPRLKLTSAGMPFSQELKIEAFLKCRAREVDGAYCRRQGRSKLRAFRDGFGLLLALLRKRLFE